MSRERSQIAKDIQRRVRVLYLIFLLAAMVVVAKIIYIQFGPEADELRDRARKITFERIALPAERGDILTSDGRILATSIPMYEIRMDFAAPGISDTLFTNQVDSLAGSLAAFFGDRNPEQYKQFLEQCRQEALADPKRRTNRYRLISPRRIDYLEEKQVGSFPIFEKGPNKGGYIKVQKNKREIPHGSLARRTIGNSTDYLEQDSTIRQVRYGIEGSYDSVLRGHDGLTMMQRISGQFKVPVADPGNVEPVNGMDVVTTIKIDIQDVAEKALKEQLEKTDADWGTVVLMEVGTGEIHAMSNLTRSAPGKYIEDFNYAIGMRLEPGSTFKLASLITLLDDAGMSLDHMIDCEGGRARVGIRQVTDTHSEGVISLRRVFEVSSNVGFAKAVNQMYGSNPGRFVDRIRALGLGQMLGIDITGEREPLVKHPKEKNSAWDGMSLVMMSYGYALEITPMHTLALYNAVANNGVMVRPRLVSSIRNYGETVSEFETDTLIDQICSPQTIQLVRSCLEGVVDEGTGRILRNPYYDVAAKTGTAQMAFRNGGYMDRNGGRNYLGTMVGYFPADNPKYTCIVAIKTYNGPGRRNTYYGAPLSGPVFKAVADRVYAVNSSWHPEVEKVNAEKPVPAEKIKYGRADLLNEVARKIPLGLSAALPEWYTAGAENSQMESSQTDSMHLSVPDVCGMGLRDALWRLESEGYRVSFEGRGRVVSQRIIDSEDAAAHVELKLKL